MKKMEELNKLPWVLKDDVGSKVYHGKRLGSTGTFAVLTKTAEGFSLAPAHEWFEFSKKSVFKAQSIEDAEAHLQDLSRQSVQNAIGMNRRIASDKLAAEALVVDAKRAILNQGVDKEERRELYGEENADEAKDDNVDYEFEFSDDDESAAVMMLGDGKKDDEDVKLVNPLAKKVLTQEEKMDIKLKEWTKEYEEAERLQKEQEEKEKKRAREEEEAGGGEGGEDKNNETKKRAKKEKAAVVMRPLTEEEVKNVLRNDPNVTLLKLIGLFKTSIGNDMDKKGKFMKIVSKVAVTKVIDGNKILRLKQ
jgi:hypothetical protein